MVARKLLVCLMAALGCGDNEPECIDGELSAGPLPECASAPCVDAFVVAHPDDDLLFMNPTILRSIHARDVVIVYVTAGELDHPPPDPYWLDRERGIVHAYERALGAEPVAYDDVTLPSETVTFDTVVAARYAVHGEHELSLIFLRLGDYQTECLWRQTPGCSTLNARRDEVPYLAQTLVGPAYISRETLLAALENLFRTYGVTSVGALDATALHYDELGTVGVGYTEYWDHHYSAMFALDAALRIGSGISVELFRGYTLTRIEPNVAASDACKKLDAFAQYAVFDSTIVEQPTPSDYWSCPDCYLSGGYQLYSSQSWQRRESATWSVAATGLLVNETGLTLDDNGEYLLFDNGQLRARDALCVTAVDTRFENLECQPQAGSDGHVTDRPPAEQTWAVYAK